MKFDIIFVLLCVASTVHCQGKESILLAIENYLETTNSEFREGCIQESGVDRALVDRFEDAEMTNDDKLKCYIQCQGFNSKVIDDKGFVNIPTLQALLKATNNNFIEKVNKECRIPKHDHLCEAAYQTCLCIWDVLNYHHHLH